MIHSPSRLSPSTRARRIINYRKWCDDNLLLLPLGGGWEGVGLSDPDSCWCASPRHRRGSAEIELLICCIILLSLILLVSGTLKIGGARLTATQQAAFQAFHNATEDSTPLYTNDPAAQPIDGIAAIRPTLPNRVHSPHPTATATGLTGGDAGGTFKVTVSGHAAVISPTWAYSAYPVGTADQAMLQTWFEDYMRDPAGVDDNTRSSLGLSAPWQP